MINAAGLCDRCLARGWCCPVDGDPECPGEECAGCDYLAGDRHRDRQESVR